MLTISRMTFSRYLKIMMLPMALFQNVFINAMVAAVIDKHAPPPKHSYNHPNSEKMQCAYKHGHSTETIQNYVVQAIDKTEFCMFSV